MTLVGTHHSQTLQKSTRLQMRHPPHMADHAVEKESRRLAHEQNAQWVILFLPWYDMDENR